MISSASLCWIVVRSGDQDVIVLDRHLNGFVERDSHRALGLGGRRQRASGAERRARQAAHETGAKGVRAAIIMLQRMPPVRAVCRRRWQTRRTASARMKMLMAKSAIRPPTMTMANGRCESEPMACEKAAGKSPKVATSMVIMIGRSRRTAPSTAASATVYPRARSWLMYSSMMTPVCTDTPKSARKPTPEATLKNVP